MKAYVSFAIFCLSILLCAECFSQDSTSAVFQLDSLPANGIELNKGWKFHEGDDTAWKDPHFDDSRWQKADLSNPNSYLPAFGKRGIGWFRLKLSMDSSLRANPVALQISQLGAIELYVKNSLLVSLGKMNAAGLIQTNDSHGKPFLFQGNLGGDTIILAVRYASPVARPTWLLTFAKPVSLKIIPWVNAVNNYKAALLEPRLRIGTSFMAIAMGLLFIMLYTFFPKEKVNLLFGVFCLFLGMLPVLFFQLREGNLNMNMFGWTSFAVDLANKICATLILVIISVEVLGKVTLFQYLLIGFILIGESLLFLTLGPSKILQTLEVIAQILLAVELFRLSVAAFKQKNFIIGLIGFGPLLLTLAVLLVIWKLLPLGSARFYFTINSFLFFAAITIYIASKYARKSNGWLHQLDETRRLAAINIEKEKERQHMLESQNEMLENQVKERTAALTESLAELKETQSQLIHAEKMASLGELTAGIAHEIQNPLNFVNNFSDVNAELIDEMNEALDKNNLGEARSLSYDIRENQEKISHHGRRADSIVKSMLQHSRASTGQKESTDINALADEYLRLSYHGLRAKDKLFNATLITDLDSTVGEIMAVPQDMGRVLLNLFNNAFYSVFQKKINLEQKKATDQPIGYEPTVWLSTTSKKDAVEICIRDNGLGVPQKILDKIFQPFFTSKPVGHGTGLGLSLSYDIVTQEHGGTLKANSVEGEYAEFIITLPIEP